MICGVDEAGKGPVMGPMVVAAVSVENAKLIEDKGFKDSKLLTPQRRNELFKLIKENYRYAVEIIQPEEIDEYRRKNQLNLLNRKAFEKKRIGSDQLKLAATFGIGVLMVNHIVSAIDVLYLKRVIADVRYCSHI